MRERKTATQIILFVLVSLRNTIIAWRVLLLDTERKKSRWLQSKKKSQRTSEERKFCYYSLDVCSQQIGASQRCERERSNFFDNGNVANKSQTLDHNQCSTTALIQEAQSSTHAFINHQRRWRSSTVAWPTINRSIIRAKCRTLCRQVRQMGHVRIARHPRYTVASD